MIAVGALDTGVDTLAQILIYIYRVHGIMFAPAMS